MSAVPLPLVYLFVGPSLDAAEAAHALAYVPADIRVLPPAQQGDVLRVLDNQPDVIGIIDGLFFQVPSITHKEILLALELGTRVLGASSIGALRAAELDGFGMQGLGEVYRCYKKGIIDGDDEVAVLHDEAFRPTTVPLVNLRHNLRRAQARKVVTAATARAVLAGARSLHFTERTVAAVLAAASAAPPDALTALDTFLRTEAVDLKREDALLLISTIAARIVGKAPWPCSPPVKTSRTIYLHLLQREYAGTGRPGRKDLPDARCLAFFKLLAPSCPDMVQRVNSRCLAVHEAMARGLASDSTETLITTFRRNHHLADAEAFNAWLRGRSMSAEELVLVLRHWALEAQVLDLVAAQYPDADGVAALSDRIRAAVAARTGLCEWELTRPPFQSPGVPWDAPLLSEVKFCGEFMPIADTATSMLRHAAAMSAGLPGLLRSLSRERLEAWAARQWGVPAAAFDAALLDRGFTDYGEFDDAVRVAYLSAHAARVR